MPLGSVLEPASCCLELRHAMTGLQAEGVIDQALFVCGAEGSWPSPEASGAMGDQSWKSLKSPSAFQRDCHVYPCNWWDRWCNNSITGCNSWQQFYRVSTFYCTISQRFALLTCLHTSNPSRRRPMWPQPSRSSGTTRRTFSACGLDESGSVCDTWKKRRTISKPCRWWVLS